MMRRQSRFAAVCAKIRVGIAASITLLACSGMPASAADWYVDGLNGRDTNSGSQAAPLQNPWRGWALAEPGDTIYLMPTMVYGPLYFSGKSGAAKKEITIKGSGRWPNLTKVSGFGNNFGIDLEKDTNYVSIQNLDITAPGAGPYGAWSGIYLSGNHHVSIIGNYVHDAGCSGIQTASSDYITISENRVANNANLTTNGIFCSGISTHENRNSDRRSAVKMTISNNIIYGNINKPLANCIYPCTNSDGNGIIIDDTRRTQTDFVAYRGATNVTNNVIFNNGGRGIHVYSSDNVNIQSNTLFQNNQDPYEGAWRPGEISVVASGGVRIYNNILSSDGAAGTVNTGAHTAVSIQDCNSGAPIVIDYNLTYNAVDDIRLQSFFRNNLVAVSVGPANKWGAPKFKNASADPAIADFRVTIGSAALAFASPLNTYPVNDILGIARVADAITAGAYQNTAP